MNYIILEFLKNLSPKDLLSFRRFITSPYFNKSKNVIRLYDTLIKYYPEFDNSEISREMLFEFSGMHAKYNRSSFDSIINDLTKLSEKFIIQKGFENSVVFEYSSLFNELLRFDSNRLLLRAFKKWDENMNNYLRSDQDFFIERYRIESARYNLLLKYQKLKSVRYIKNIENSYKEIYINLIYHYSLKISKCYINNKSHGIINGNNDLRRILNDLNVRSTIERLKKNNQYFRYMFLLNIYSSMINMFDKPEKDNYYAICYKNIKMYEYKINKDELNYLYSRLIDYCIIRRSSRYDEKLIELYKIFLEKKYYENKVQNFINADLWRNILIIGVKLNKIKWLEEIINKYSNKINNIYRVSLKNYSHCVLNFLKKDFETALAKLNKIPIDYFLYKNDFYGFNIMINYEIGNYTEIYQVLENFTKYIKSSNYSAKEEAKNTNFVSIVKKLNNIKHRSKKYSYNSLSKFINSKPLIHKKWIMEKLEELA